MNITSRLKKLEKEIIPNDIPQNIFAKLGMLPIVTFEPDTLEAEQEKIIEATKAKYYDKLANELHTTPEHAKELYKKSGLNPECLVIHIVS